MNPGTFAGVAKVTARPLDMPTLENGLVMGSNGALASATTSSTSYVDVVNYTGAGVLMLFAMTDGGSGAARCRVIIDGVVIYENTAGNSTSYPIVGNVTGYTGYEQIPFKSSLQIQHRAPSGSVTSYYKYRKTR